VQGYSLVLQGESCISVNAYFLLLFTISNWYSLHIDCYSGK